MSQVKVERVLGVLVTDEALRRRFAVDPEATLLELTGNGIELTAGERRALATLDHDQLERFAGMIDSRLQKCDLKRRLS